MSLLKTVPHLLMGHAPSHQGRGIPVYFLQTQPEWLKEPTTPHPKGFGSTDASYLFGLLELMRKEEMKDVMFHGLLHPVTSRFKEEGSWECETTFQFEHPALPWTAGFDGFGRPHITQRFYGDRYLTIHADTAFLREGPGAQGRLMRQFVRTVNEHGVVDWALVAERRLTQVSLIPGQAPTDRIHIYATLTRLLLAAIPRLRQEGELPTIVEEFWREPRGTWLGLETRFTEEYSVTMAGVAPQKKELALYAQYGAVSPQQVTCDDLVTILTTVRGVYASEQGAEQTRKAFMEKRFFGNGVIPPPDKAGEA